MSTPIICDTKDITPDDAFKRLVRTDENGMPALNVAVVSPGEGEYVDCDLKELSARDLFFRMITYDADGNWALRVIETTE